MRNAVLLALVGALSGHALGGEPAERALPNPEQGGPIAEPRVPTPQPGPRGCEAIEADARALLEEARACSPEVGCAMLSFDQLVGPANCVAAFQCSGTVSGDLDRAAFLEAVASLVVEKLACGECATAACMPPAELVPTCVQGRCELLQR
jgi:hypothetical protein